MKSRDGANSEQGTCVCWHNIMYALLRWQLRACAASACHAPCLARFVRIALTWRCRMSHAGCEQLRDFPPAHVCHTPHVHTSTLRRRLFSPRTASFCQTRSLQCRSPTQQSVPFQLEDDSYQSLACCSWCAAVTGSVAKERERAWAPPSHQSPSSASACMGSAFT